MKPTAHGNFDKFEHGIYVSVMEKIIISTDSLSGPQQSTAMA